MNSEHRRLELALTIAKKDLRKKTKEFETLLEVSESRLHKINELKAIIQKYADCTEDCANRISSDRKTPCDCGLDKALTELKVEKE